MISSELVSIIVPVYNGEKYIEHCIQSIESQNYKNIELLIIDDGSIDHTYDIVSNLKDKYNNIKFYSGPNKGVCHARNLGLSKANGEWIAFVDADDYLEFNFLSRLMEVAIKEKSQCVCCGIKKVFPNHQEYINNNKEIFCFDSNDWLLNLLNVQKCYGFVHTKLINKKILQGIIFDEELVVMEDCLFNLELLKNNDKFVVLNESLYNYSINSDSAVHKYDVNYCNKYEKALIRIKKYLDDEYGNDSDVLQSFSNLVVYHLFLIAVNYCFHPENETINKRKLLNDICEREIFKDALKESNYQNISITRQITLFTLKHKLYFLTEIICNIRQKQINKQ